MSDEMLPPLPPSDQESLGRNKYDCFYGVKSRDFWGKCMINTFKVEEPKKCDHEFRGKPGGVECVRCHFGLLGQLEISKGKLFYKGKLLEI